MKEKERATILVAVSVMLFFGIFIGDGKQALVEVYGSAIVLVVWGWRLLQKSAPTHIPNRLFYPWAFTFIVACLSMFQSDSVGYSLSWIIRFVEAYIVFYMFYCDYSLSLLKRVIYISFIFVMLASVVAGLSILFPKMSAVLPSMNLVTIRYGHNHLADLLVFISPLIWWATVDTKNWRVWQGVGVWIVYVVALITTLARGSWIIVGVYVVYKAFMTKQKHRWWTLFIPFALLIFGMGSVYLYVSGNIQPSYASILKPLTIISRVEYWRQAAASWSEKFLLGSGPGTFSLASMRTQRSKGMSSWFAHSLPLQAASEMGILGLCAISWLIVSHFKYTKVFRRGTNDHETLLRRLAEGALLLLLYGSIEFVFDYLITWLLFWMILSIVCGSMWRYHTNE